MKYKYLLFDLDNTLLDFDASEAFALRKTFEDEGIAFDAHINQTYHHINKACWHLFENNDISLAELKLMRMQRTLDALQLKDIDPIQFSHQYHANLGKTDFFVQGAADLIQQLYQKHELVLITNGIAEVQHARLYNTDLATYFPVKVISETIGFSKPDGRFFDHTFEQIGNPPKDQVLVIGDSLNSDIKGGNNYGIDTCWHNFKKNKAKPNIVPTYEISRLDELHRILHLSAK